MDTATTAAPAMPSRDPITSGLVSRRTAATPEPMIPSTSKITDKILME